MDAVDRAAVSQLGQKILRGSKPGDLYEFQSKVPLTTYSDYDPFLSDRDEGSLSEKPFLWCHSSGRGGRYKWIPQTEQCYEKATRNFIGSCLLASARKRGEVRIRPSFKLLATLPPPPYTSGTVYDYLMSRISFMPIPHPDQVEGLEFPDKLQKGFEIALREGVDILGAISSVLVRMGQAFASSARKKKFSLSMLHPKVVARMVRAISRAKRENRGLLPKDLWAPKGIVAGGMDTFIYKNDIAHYWGTEPFDFYVTTETLFIAMQAWNKKAMSFIPDSVFFEFIPLESSGQVSDPSQKPLTLGQLEEGKLYEVVVTQFHGMPLMRYRIGDVIKVLSMNDEETGIMLPQISIQRKVGETIDLAGLSSLDEKTIWQAISNAELEYTDWAALKEFEDNQSYLRIYLELREPEEPREVEAMIHENLQLLDEDYRDVERYLGFNPIKVTLLSPGTFMSYIGESRREGADLAHLKPKHINPGQAAIQRLLIWSKVTAGESTVPDRSQ
jgi:hypothetical protein